MAPEDNTVQVQNFPEIDMNHFSDEEIPMSDTTTVELLHLPGEPGGDIYDCSHHVAVTLTYVVEYGCYGGVLDLTDEEVRDAITELVNDRVSAAGGVEVYDISRLEVFDTCQDDGAVVAEPSPPVVWTEHDGDRQETIA